MIETSVDSDWDLTPYGLYSTYTENFMCKLLFNVVKISLNFRESFSDFNCTPCYRFNRESNVSFR
jgi:hypothetical protein